MRRSLLAALAAAGFGAIVYLRRSRAAAPRVVAHYEDGSILTLDASGPDGQRLVAAAERGLAAVHSLSP